MIEIAWERLGARRRARGPAYWRRATAGPAGFLMTTFARIVCGVDGSAASLEAVRQADRLLEPGGSLTLVAAADLTQHRA